MPDPLPPIGTRVKIKCGGYKDYTAKVIDVYTRLDGHRVVEVLTDSGLPLIYGPIHLEVIAYPVTVLPVVVKDLQPA